MATFRWCVNLRGHSAASVSPCSKVESAAPGTVSSQSAADLLISRAACCTALTMFWYPVHLHMLPSSS